MRKKDAKPSLKLHIDWTLCDGRGLCTELLPGVLDRDEWGYPLPRNGEREPVIPRAAEGYARAAVRRCPRLALSLTATAHESKGGRSRSSRASKVRRRTVRRE